MTVSDILLKWVPFMKEGEWEENGSRKEYVYMYVYVCMYVYIRSCVYVYV